MNIGNKVLILSLGLAVFASSCKKDKPDETTCVAPSAPTASNDSPKSVGSSIQLSATTVEGATYSWTGPNKFTSTLQNPTITYSNSNNLGEYSVVAIVNGCSSAKAFTYITACDTPSVSTNSPVVQGNPINLSAQLIPGATYTWTKVGNPAFSSNEPSVTIATTPSDSVAGVYQVVISYNGCTTPPKQVDVVVVPAKPKITGTFTYTVGGTLSLTASSTTPGVSYRWSRPNAPDTVTPTLTIPNVARKNKGNYSVVAFKGSLVSDDSTRAVNVLFNTTIGCAGVTSATANGFTYNTVEIINGTTKQCWLRSNLKQAANDSLWEYDALMNTAIVTVEQQGMCPVGFHVASDAEWTILQGAAGNSSDPLKAVQAGSTGTNTTGFTLGLGVFPTVNMWTYTWNTTIDGTQNWIYYRRFAKADNSIVRDLINKVPLGTKPNMYVRCLKD